MASEPDGTPANQAEDAELRLPVPRAVQGDLVQPNEGNVSGTSERDSNPKSS